jgi:mono/diheme cytochrome c family protein
MKRTKRDILIVITAVTVLVVVIGITAWYKLCRDVPQPGWITADQRSDFLYGSVGAEGPAGMPYWIWLALPRMFPEHLPGEGGYVSLGLSWEEGREMPAGFSKKTIGYVRVAGNCALCHAASYRKGPDEGPAVVLAVPGHTTDIKGLLSFFSQCAQDPRFNADEILAEIDTATKLSFLDRLLYRYVLIPRTRRALLNRDAVIVDSTLRLHSLDPHLDAPLSQSRIKVLAAWLKGLQAPPYPLPVNTALVAAGKPLFVRHCGSCHAPDGTGKQTGTVIPIAEIGTDRERLDMTKTRGYLAGPLDGVWARGPYLHNGSVPTVRDLLNPQAQRPPTFYRGNNLIDTRNVGFISTLAQEKGLQFFLYDTAQPGNSNSGHLYGISLSDPEKDALLEYLKTL